MVDFKSRRHRLELPSIPTSDDPAVLKRAMDQMKRLVQDEFNRLATDFYDFKQTTYNAAIIPLRGVSNITVTKDQYSVSATWELPDGDEITPTHVRVRILEISPNSWSLYTYPKTSWEFNGLTPGTQYTLQVQLVATFEATDTFISTTRNCPSVPVLRTAESDIKAKVFTTDDGVGPPTDGGTNNEVITFNFPNTQGTPGTVGGANCWWEYKIQYRAACAWVDTGAGGAEVDGNVGDVTIDTAAAPFTTYPNALFRLAYREICNSIPQDWVYAEPFMALDYANADCLGIVKSASLGESPFDTATLFALPSVCQEDGTWLQIVDALTDTEFLPQEPGFKCIEYIDDEWTLIADDTSDFAISNTIFQGLLSGTIAAIANFNGDTDFTIGFDIKVADNALVLAGGTGAYTIIDIGGKIKAQLIENTSTYSMQIQVPRDGGGAYVFRADDLVYGDWVRVYYVHDVSEPDGRVLYINGFEIERSTNAIANDFDGITGEVQINTVNDMQLRRFYGWDIAVVPTVDPVGQGIAAGGLNTSNVPQDQIYLYAMSTDTWSTPSAVIPVAVRNLTALAETGTYAWLVGGDNITNTPQTGVARWFWSTSVASVGAPAPTGTGGAGPMDNPGSAGYTYGTATSDLDIQKMVYATETWSDSGADAITDFPQATASNWGVAAYAWGRDGSNRYRKFTFSSETAATLTGGFAGDTTFRPTGVSHQGTAMYAMGGNGTDTVRKVSYATDTAALTTLGTTLIARGQKNIFGHIGDSPTRGITAGGERGSGDERAEVDEMDYATDTASAGTSMPSPRESAGLCSGM